MRRLFRNRLRVIALAGATVVSVATLTSCASGPESQGTQTVAPPTQSPTASTPASATSAPESPSPVADPLALPSCADLLTSQQIGELMGDGVEVLDESDPAEMIGYMGLSPETLDAATEAIAESVQSLACGWGFPGTDAVLPGVVAELPTDTVDALITAVDDDEAFTASALDDATAYSMEFFYELLGVNATVYFVVEGNVWIALNLMPSEEFAAPIASAILDSVNAANAG